MTSSVTQTPGLRFINASDARAEIPLIYNPTTGDYDLATSSDGLLNVATFVWNTGTLSWDKATQAGGGGGGGAAVTIADGADIAEGATTDAAVITDVAGTISGKLRGLVKWAFERMPVSLGQKVMAESFPVTIASNQSQIEVSIVAQTIPVTVALGGLVTVYKPVTDLIGNSPATASVGVASATALAANVDRKGAVFVNLSVNTISFGLDGSAAVLNSGITLTPFGTWVMDDYTFTIGEITAIASAAASTLSIQEFQ
jgi:hypothetical protein